MRRTWILAAPAILAVTLLPASTLAWAFAFDFEYYRSDVEEYDASDDVEADIEDLEASLYYTGQGWDLLVHYKVEVEHAPVGYCDLVLDVVDRDFPSAPIRITIPLDQPRRFDDDEVIYSARTRTQIALEHIRNPDRLRLYGYTVPAGGGPTLDRESTRVKFRR